MEAMKKISHRLPLTCRRSAPMTETLERRTFLTSVVVNTPIDAVFPPSTGIVSLRMAIATANSSLTPTTITFDPKAFASPQIITLNSTGLTVANGQKVTIVGPSAQLTLSESAGAKGPILQLNNVSAAISNIIFANGSGGGINFNGNNQMPLSLTNVTVTGCSGGAALEGVSTLTNVTISNNIAPYRDGAGLYVSGTLNFTNGTISGNQTANEHGGGLYNAGNATLIGVTVSNNTAAFGGGGLFNQVTATLINDTFYGNHGGSTAGGAIFNASALTATNLTVVNNSANSGGGMAASSGSATTVANVIVAGNSLSGSGGAGPDASGAFASLGYNLIGKTDGSTGWNSFDRTGTAAHPLDPKLGPLASNGGPTLTMLPLAGSPAIDHGWNAVLPKGISTDQRGLTRIVNGTVDIGAVEVQPAPVTGSIAGNVFGDANANGKLDTGEKGLSGVKVYIDANKNGAIDSGETSIATDSSGNFKFNLSAGTYRIREVLPVGYAITAPTAGYFDVTLKAGQALTGFAFADAPATAKISGRVFADGNGNGLRDSGELGLGLWQVFIDYNNDGKIDGKDVSATTDAFGNWSFTGLIAGTYTVRVVQFSGTVATKPTGGVLTIKLSAGQASTSNLCGERAVG
jgi:uncharacterized protein (DUF2141 family)